MIPATPLPPTLLCCLVWKPRLWPRWRSGSERQKAKHTLFPYIWLSLTVLLTLPKKRREKEQKCRKYISTRMSFWGVVWFLGECTTETAQYTCARWGDEQKQSAGAGAGACACACACTFPLPRNPFAAVWKWLIRSLARSGLFVAYFSFLFLFWPYGHVETTSDVEEG